MVKEKQRKGNLPGCTMREINNFSVFDRPVLFVISAIVVATDLILPERGEVVVSLLPITDRWYAFEIWSGVKTGASDEVFFPDDNPIAMEEIKRAAEGGRIDTREYSSALQDKF